MVGRWSRGARSHPQIDCQMMQHLFDNWKTSSAGLVMIIGAVVHLVFGIIDHKADETMWTTSLGAIVGGIGLIAAGDASKSRQDVAKVDAKVEQIATDTSVDITNGTHES